MHSFSRLYSIAIAFLASVLLVSTIKADTIHFALTDGTNNISFDILTAPNTLTGTPSSFNANSSDFSVSAVINGGAAVAEQVSFYSAFYGGDLCCGL